MKKIEIAECLRAYRDGLDAYSEVVDKLRGSFKAADGIPLLKLSQRWLEEAEADLEKLGDLLALLPEVALELGKARRLHEQVMRQAKLAGVDLRYDIEEGKEDADDEG